MIARLICLVTGHDDLKVCRGDRLGVFCQACGRVSFLQLEPKPLHFTKPTKQNVVAFRKRA